VSFFLWVLLLVGLRFIFGLRKRLDSVEGQLSRHERTIDELTDRLRERKKPVAPPAPGVAPPVSSEVIKAPAAAAPRLLQPRRRPRPNRS
jgi:biopolymer transport protein ExbB/TolQ